MSAEREIPGTHLLWILDVSLWHGHAAVGA